MPKLNSAVDLGGIVMPRSLVLIGIALMVLSASARAQDYKAILGKTISYRGESEVTSSSGQTAVRQMEGKVRITKDGREFFGHPAQGGEFGNVGRIDRTVDALSTPDALPPPSIIGAGYSTLSATMTVTFGGRLLTWFADAKGMLNSDRSKCDSITGGVIAFSPDFTSCSINSTVVNPCGNGYTISRAVRTLSCTVSSD
jgi:hypothetical protein